MQIDKNTQQRQYGGCNAFAAVFRQGNKILAKGIQPYIEDETLLTNKSKIIRLKSNKNEEELLP